jgi:calcium permeable stress-gated cation channel
VYHELNAFVRIRQEHLTAEEHRNTVRATTILVTTVPDNFLDVNVLRQLFSVFPGGVKNVFLNRDCSSLLDLVEERDKVAKKLEAAETDLIVLANKNERKQREKASKGKEVRKSVEKQQENSRLVEMDVLESVEPSRANDLEQTKQTAPQAVRGGEYLADKWVPEKKRSTHRLPVASWMPSLFFIGKKALISPNSF